MGGGQVAVYGTCLYSPFNFAVNLKPNKNPNKQINQQSFKGVFWSHTCFAGTSKHDLTSQRAI